MRHSDKFYNENLQIPVIDINFLHRLFWRFRADLCPEHRDLLGHSDFRWLIKGTDLGDKAT